MGEYDFTVTDVLKRLSEDQQFREQFLLLIDELIRLLRLPADNAN
nr:MAG TPA: hypothetical protein [Caudoviricetes sp.]DAT13315.1 MAG TPA: hypothetical protein [Caudoviricetes sp.]